LRTIKDQNIVSILNSTLRFAESQAAHFTGSYELSSYLERTDSILLFNFKHNKIIGYAGQLTGEK
jgi:hypothetical protein